MIVAKEILFGIILGGAKLETYDGRKNWRLKVFNSNEKYIYHLYDIFKFYVKTKPRLDNNNNWYFNTQNTISPYLNEFHLINSESLNKYLTPLSLAYWYMSAGSKKPKVNAYYFNTKSFKLDDLKLISSIFKDKYNIDVNYHKKGSSYDLYIPVREGDKFMKIIEPYLKYNN